MTEHPSRPRAPRPRQAATDLESAAGPAGTETAEVTSTAAGRPHRTLLVVPAFNEEASIGATLAEMATTCAWADVVVVDDGSQDGTAALARGAGVEVLPLPFNVGIGGAVQTGFQYALEHDYDVAVQVDADGQHPAGEVHRLVGPVVAGDCDVAVGSRFLREGDYEQTWARAVGIAILARVISVLTRRKMTDPTSGFRAYGRDAIRLLAAQYPYDYPEPEALVLLHRAGLRVQDVPVRMSPRRDGESSIGRAVAMRYMFKVLLAVGVSMLRPAPKVPSRVRTDR